MAEHEKQPFEAEISDRLEAHATQSEAEADAALNLPASNWEGYSLEILSIWFDP